MGVKIDYLKEPEYIIMLMSSCGMLENVGANKTCFFLQGDNIMKRLPKYPELVYNHFLYKDAVDTHDSSRIFSTAMEEI